MDYDDVIRFLPLYKAALEDDWESANRFFQDDEEKLTAKITYWWETPLHIAVGTNRSHRFVKELVERIMAAGGVEKLRTPSWWKNNSLHYAAKVGNTTAVKLLVEKDPDMPQIANPGGNTALKLAAWYAQKETLCYLLEVTQDVVGEDGTSPFRGLAGADLITLTITAGFYDVALYLVENYPNLVIEKDRNNQTALQTLAAKSNAFPSGSALGFWQLIIYSWIPVNRETAFESPIKGIDKAEYSTTNTEAREKGATTNLLIRFFKRAHYRLNVGFRSVLRYLVPYIKNIHDIKLTHIQVEQLVKAICSTVIKKVDHSIAWDVLGTSVSTAVTHGTHEIIEECIRNYPGLVWYDVQGFYLFLAAIKHRQEKVYNLVYQMSGHKVFAATEKINEENALHIAGKLAPQHRLNIVTGAALQMQRELQWFKEVEKFVEPSFKEALNSDHKTPRMVFSEAHEKLIKEGQQWMKDTSSSSTVVGALIVTMAFAAMFTVPGGNNGDGKPLFLQDAAFMLFAVSDGVALFSSSTSVLMFLSILTSRYAEEDFLYALPKRLTIGLLSLFMSLAATMVAFSATFVIVLRDKVDWIIIPVTLVACIPVSLFVMLQFPLLLELVRSTYGKGIFYKQNDQLLH